MNCRSCGSSPAGISQPIHYWAYCDGSVSLVRSRSMQRSQNKARPRRSEARRACSAFGTLEHDAARFKTPPLRRYGRSGARAPSIYIGREPDAATSIPDGAADVKFNVPAVALACYYGGGPHRGGGRIGPGVDTKRGGLWRRAVGAQAYPQFQEYVITIVFIWDLSSKLEPARRRSVVWCLASSWSWRQLPCHDPTGEVAWRQRARPPFFLASKRRAGPSLARVDAPIQSNPMGDRLQQAASQPEGFLLYEGEEVARELRRSLTHV
ncbi:hypothetical protein THAOC_37855, partial [Thalassiosira oceanica]